MRSTAPFDAVRRFSGRSRSTHKALAGASAPPPETHAAARVLRYLDSFPSALLPADTSALEAFHRHLRSSARPLRPPDAF